MNALESVSFPAKPWTGSQIKHLRKAMIDGQDAIDGLSYEDVSDWYMQVIGHIVNAIYEIDTTSLGIPDLRISSRVKTVGALRDKLIRTPGMQIPNIHDIMSVRIACDMTLTEQDKLVSLLADSLPVHQILDIRTSPHSGYRAVHVILKLSNGVFAEVQVRGGDVFLDSLTGRRTPSWRSTAGSSATGPWAVRQIRTLRRRRDPRARLSRQGRVAVVVRGPARGGAPRGNAGTLLLQPLPVPHIQYRPARIPQLMDHIRGTVLVLDVQIHRPLALLPAIRHADALLDSTSPRKRHHLAVNTFIRSHTEGEPHEP